MKLHALLCAAALSIAVSACSSENVTHDAGILPAEARDIISRNFTSAVSLVEQEKSMGSTKEYEVTLTDGSEITFTGSGEWKSVDVPNNRAVPAGLVPTSIAKYVAAKHAGANIVGIERDKKGYEVELSNGVDINFDVAGNFVSYDK